MSSASDEPQIVAATVAEKVEQGRKASAIHGFLRKL